MSVITTKINRPAFRLRCQAEGTRAVIFLFQVRQKGDKGDWRTEGVWLSREEAESWAESTAYNHGGIEGRGKTWRVYGVCANGELAELLEGT